MAQAALKQSEKKSAVDVLIDEFGRDYGDAWEECKLAKETTDTIGWKSFYQNEIHEQRQSRQEIAKEIEAHAESFKAHGSNEESEKELGDMKKMEAQLRDRVNGWRSRVVYPMRSRVDRCNSILTNYMGKAREIATESPLLHKDAELAMRESQRTHARASWNDEDGTIEISSPNDQ